MAKKESSEDRLKRLVMAYHDRMMIDVMADYHNTISDRDIEGKDNRTVNALIMRRTIRDSIDNYARQFGSQSVEFMALKKNIELQLGQILDGTIQYV